jgi:hypothetical protein
LFCPPPFSFFDKLEPFSFFDKLEPLDCTAIPLNFRTFGSAQALGRHYQVSGHGAADRPMMRRPVTRKSYLVHFKAEKRRTSAVGQPQADRLS